jgi:lon-related putative ATP-dependent protease
MTDPRPLPPEELHLPCDPGTLGFETTEELDPPGGALGQEEAMEALAFGVSVPSAGYNLFVAGQPGSGRTTMVRRILQERAAHRPSPPDWCYVFNFREPRKPRAVRLPAGRGRELRDDMEWLLSELRHAIPIALDSDDVAGRRAQLFQERAREAAAALAELRGEVEDDGHVAFIGGDEGLTVVPARGGEPLSREAFEALPEDVRSEIDERVREVAGRLFQVQRRSVELHREARDRAVDLHREVVRSVAAHRVEMLKDRYREAEGVAEYLDEVTEDVVRFAHRFARGDGGDGNGGPTEDVAEELLVGQQQDFFRRYMVNPLIHRVAHRPAPAEGAPGEGVPVVEEANPTLRNLLGRVEGRIRFGFMVTDLTRIVPGALHRANGGYLVLEAAQLLSRPYAWGALKRTLQTGELRPGDAGEETGLPSVESLEPAPIPLDVKVVLVGEVHLFYLLQGMDPDFAELFKVKVDFGPRMPRTPEAERAFGAFIGARCREEDLPHFDAGAVARVIDEAARRAGDRTKLTTRFRDILDLVHESAHMAVQAGETVVAASRVEEALAARVRRNRRPHRELLELIDRGIIAFHPQGERVGQLYGIALNSLGEELFGRPIRVMASAFLGTAGVINIEREASLAGPLHTKGFLVLSGYLGRRFAAENPLVLSASLSFDQLYEEVEGDSASAAELYALMSAVGEIPLRQGIAVTGALNQEGIVLPVGGVTEKVEGFFDACLKAGLTGAQGVVLPRRNVGGLMLRAEIRDAVARGRFHVWAVDRVEEGWPILAGRPAGAREDHGEFVAGSVNRAVADRLARWADLWRGFGRAGDPGQDAPGPSAGGAAGNPPGAHGEA